VFRGLVSGLLVHVKLARISERAVALNLARR